MFLLYGVDCRSPTEAEFLPPEGLELTDVTDHREQLMLSLKAARESAISSMRTAQGCYKALYIYIYTPYRGFLTRTQIVAK